MMEYYSWFFIKIAFERNVSTGHCRIIYISQIEIESFSVRDVQEINSQTENETRTHIRSGNSVLARQ